MMYPFWLICEGTLDPEHHFFIVVGDDVDMCDSIAVEWKISPKVFHKFNMQDFVVYFVDHLGIIQVEVTSTIIRILVLPYGNLDENKYCHLKYWKLLQLRFNF